MENTQEKILSEIKNLVREMHVKVELLENKYIELEKILSSKTLADTVPEPVSEEDEPIDIDFGIEDVFNEAVPAADDALPEKMADHVPASYGIPEPEPVESVLVEPEAMKPSPVEPPAHVAVLDAMAEKQAWRKALPGAAVNDVRSAISLNDRILFIRSLFSDDAVLFQNTLDRINSAGSLDEAAGWLMSEFGGWNFESDTVYRFMMAVRRKLK